MSRAELAGIRVAVLAADGFEQLELTRPRATLLKHGADVEIISLRPGSIQGMNLLVPGERVRVDRTVFAADPDDYHCMLIPGGFANPDFLRQSRHVLDFVAQMDDAAKPIASICHGPWVLISAGLVAGRRLTSWPGIRDDVCNAGGKWEDRPVVRDGNWITSRGPQDLLRFDKALVEHFSPMYNARERTSHSPVGRAVAGGLALAALGYGLRRWDRDDPAVH